MRLHQDMLRHNSHSLSYLSAHFVFVTKYRHKVIVNDKVDFLYRCFHYLAHQLDVNIQVLHIDIDHIHMLAEYPPSFSISEIVRRFKGASARYIRIQYPELTEHTNHSSISFWSRGYFVTSVGEDAEERIRRYVLHHTDFS